MNIIIDTREQNPLTWSNFTSIGTCSDTLLCGDYTLSGHDMPKDDYSIIIERKANCRELLTNLVVSFDRFEVEMTKMSQYHNKMILVCGYDDFSDLYDKGYTKVHPNFAYKRLAYIHAKYQIPTLFFPNRYETEVYIFRMFKEILDITRLDNE